MTSNSMWQLSSLLFSVFCSFWLSVALLFSVVLVAVFIVTGLTRSLLWLSSITRANKKQGQP